MDKDFPRVNQLPPYVFDEIQALKATARKEGKDIIDFGMGNPDKATPEEIVEKLRESAYLNLALIDILSQKVYLG